MYSPNSSPKFLIVTAMKNEAPYILEWVAHHMSVGFDGFLVFTNDCDDGTDLMLERLGHIAPVQHVPNPKQLFPNKGNFQVMALRYARMFPRYRNAEWIYHTDVDEFLYVKSGNATVAEFLADTGPADVVSFTSIPFNSNGRKKFEDDFITAQFTQYNRHHNDLKAEDGNIELTAIKTMYRNEISFDLRRNHRPLLSNFSETGKIWINGSGQKMSEEFVDGKLKAIDCLTSTKFAQMNHYAIKSIESFLIKVARGDIVTQSRLGQSENYWAGYNTPGDPVDAFSKKSEAFTQIYDWLLEDAEIRELHLAACEIHKAKIRGILSTEDGRTLARAIGYIEMASA